jgi:hypothetical protein
MGFGDLLSESSERTDRVVHEACEARQRVESVFLCSLKDSSSVPHILDDIIQDMWNEGWSPDKGNINLFTRDFGLVLFSALLSLFGGNVVFRSDEDITHLSLWWPASGFEVFPFHHVLRCLLERESDSVASFVKGLVGLLQSEPRLDE